MKEIHQNIGIENDMREYSFKRSEKKRNRKGQGRSRLPRGGGSSLDLFFGDICGTYRC